MAAFFQQHPVPSIENLHAWARACNVSFKAAQRAMLRDLGLPVADPTPLTLLGDLSVQTGVNAPRHAELALRVPDNMVEQIRAAWARARARPANMYYH